MLYPSSRGYSGGSRVSSYRPSSYRAPSRSTSSYKPTTYKYYNKYTTVKNTRTYSNKSYNYGTMRTYSPLYVYFLPVGLHFPIAYYSPMYGRLYYDGYGYNFYYGQYGYYEYSFNGVESKTMMSGWTIF